MSSKKSGFLRTFFTVIALILFGILIGVLAARYIPMPSRSIIPTPTPSITISPSTTLQITPVSTNSGEYNPIATISAKTYTNSQYNFSVELPTGWVSERYSSTDPRIPYLKDITTGYIISFIHLKDENDQVFSSTGQKTLTINGLTTYLRENFQGDDGLYTSYTFKIAEGEYLQLLLPLTNNPSNITYKQSEIDTAIDVVNSFKISK